MNVTLEAMRASAARQDNEGAALCASMAIAEGLEECARSLAILAGPPRDDLAPADDEAAFAAGQQIVLGFLNGCDAKQLEHEAAGMLGTLEGGADSTGAAFLAVLRKWAGEL